MAVLKRKINGKWISVVAVNSSLFIDKSKDFEAQTEFKDPMEYLRSLKDGAWKISQGGMLFYLEKVTVPGGMAVRHETTLSDDTFIYEELWVGDRLEYRRDTELGKIEFCQETLASERYVKQSIGFPDESKVGSVPVVSLAGKLELQKIVNAEEVAW